MSQADLKNVRIKELPDSFKRTWTRDIARSNFNTVKEYMPHAHAFRSNGAKLENARYGRMFSKSEEEALLHFRQAPLPINISAAICDTADAMMTSILPSISVAPIIHPKSRSITEASRNVAQLQKHLIQKSWNDSLGSLQYDRIIMDQSNAGLGLGYAVPRNENGEFKVDIKQISWKYFLPDPSCRDPLYSNADALLYSMPITKKAAYKFVKSIEGDITWEQFEEYFVGGEQPFSSLFEEDPVYARTARQKDSTFFMQLMTLEDQVSYTIIPKVDDLTQIRFRKVTELTDDLKTLEKAGKIEIRRKQDLYLTEYTSIGDLGYQVSYPIQMYNIVPFPYDHRGDSPYPYSRMWNLYPLNRALNKFMMNAILNSSLMNSTRVIAEENSVVNMKEWVTSASMPGVVLRYRLPVPGQSVPPQVVNPIPLTDAWLQMPRFIIYLMEYISGIFGISQGDGSNAPNVFSTVASLQSAAGQKIKRRQANADASLSLLAEVVGSFYQHYAPLNGYSVSMQPGKDQEVITPYNNQIAITEGEGSNIKARIQTDPDTDLSIGFRNVRFTSEATGGHESATQAMLLTQLAQQFNEPALIPMILKTVNMSGSDDIIDSIDKRKQLEASNAEMEGMIKKLNSQSESFQKQIFGLAKNLEASKAKGSLDVELEKFKSNPMDYIKNAMNNQGDR